MRRRLVSPASWASRAVPSVTYFKALERRMRLLDRIPPNRNSRLIVSKFLRLERAG
jgi:hypothetical protein